MARASLIESLKEEVSACNAKRNKFKEPAQEVKTNLYNETMATRKLKSKNEESMRALKQLQEKL